MGLRRAHRNSSGEEGSAVSPRPANTSNQRHRSPLHPDRSPRAQWRDLQCALRLSQIPRQATALTPKVSSGDKELR
jgi:hypothetical protein